MIQPLVENAIEHGLAKDELGIIKIEFKLNQNKNYISVKLTENGLGLEIHHSISVNKHRALNILLERIDVLRKSKDKSLTNLTSHIENNLFTLEVTLPIIHEN